MKYGELKDLAELITRHRLSSTSEFVEDAMAFFNLDLKIVIISGVSTKGFIPGTHFSALTNALISSLHFNRYVEGSDTFFCRFPSKFDVGLLIKLKVRSVIYLEDNDTMDETIPVLLDHSIDVMRYDSETDSLVKPTYVVRDKDEKALRFLGQEEPEIVVKKSTKKFF